MDKYGTTFYFPECLYLFWISLNCYGIGSFDSSSNSWNKKETQFTNSEHRRAHSNFYGGSYGQSGVSLNKDRWRWIPAFQLSVCGRWEQNEMHFLCNTHCCNSLISLHFIWTSVLLVQNPYITAPSHPFCLFSSIPVQSVTLYQSGLFYGTFIVLHCHILKLQYTSHHLFLLYGKEQNDILQYICFCI